MSERQPIPFELKQESGLSELGGATGLSANVLVDSNGVVRTRPGLVVSSLYSDTVDEDGLSALHVTASDIVYAIGATAGARKAYRISGGFSDLTADPGTAKLAGSGRPVIAETEAMLAIAGGTVPRKILLSDDSFTALENVPSDCTHVIAQGSRLLINDTSSKGVIHYSGQALGSSITGHETWSGLNTGFFSHEARPDPLIALHENTNEVFGFGSSSLQVWAPDATLGYAASVTREYGCAAPYSVIKREQSFGFLDHQRRIVLSDGRTAQVISQPIQKTLDDLTTVSDCWAFWFHEGIADCLVWVFPTERRAFCYQVGHGWSEWLGYSNAEANWSPLNIGCMAYRPYLGERLVGTLDGKVAKLTRDATTDLGSPINAHIRSGFLNRKTDSWKHCRAISIGLRRGRTDGSGSPIGWISWRDEPDAEWSRAPVSLGSYADRTPVVRLAGLGSYRRRQWRFEFSEGDLELASVEEDFTVRGV